MRDFYIDYRIAELMEDWHNIWGGYEGESLISGEGKWYIDESCYDLLKPKEGDLIQHNDIVDWVYKLPNNDNNVVGSRSNIFYAPYKIIQRQGKAFFMPEVEK